EPIELIVVDHGSDDETAAVIKGFGDAARYEYQPRGGNGAARNRAVELARGAHFAFLHADDRFVPNKLERQMQVLRDDRGVHAVFGHMREFMSPALAVDGTARLRR